MNTLTLSCECDLGKIKNVVARNASDSSFFDPLHFIVVFGVLSYAADAEDTAVAEYIFF